MKIINVVQGSPEWHALRSGYFTASEAAAMMGVGKVSRSDLLKIKTIGGDDPSEWVQRFLFDKGHEAEASARVLLEEQIGEELYPITCTEQIEGLPLLASLDGATMGEDVLFEHKLWNKDLAASVVAGNVPETHYWQLEHQLLITGARKVVFVVSDGSRDSWAQCDYLPVPERRMALMRGWHQFAEDLANYHPELPSPAPIGATVDALPVPALQIEGRVLASNMPLFRDRAEAFIARLPQADALRSDQDFADAENAVKACKEAEDRLATVKATAQAQAADIDAVFREIDSVSARLRDSRLALDRVVRARKEAIRLEIVTNAKQSLAEHVGRLNQRLGGAWTPLQDGGFGEAIKGHKTVTSIRDACDTALARAKINANEIADQIEINKQSMAGREHLVPDFSYVCTKSAEDFASMLAVRKAEAERREVERKAEVERREIERQEEAKRRVLLEQAQAEAAPVATVHEPVPTEALAANTIEDEPATLAIGEIGRRLGFTLSESFIENTLGIPPSGRKGRSVLFRERQWDALCRELSAHVLRCSRLRQPSSPPVTAHTGA